MDGVVGYLVSLVLGGGLLKAIESFYRAVKDSKTADQLAKQVGAKTPAEIEQIAVNTMATALKSSEERNAALTEEREADRLWYTRQIEDLRAQLQHVRAEMQAMEQKLAELLADTHPQKEV